MTQAAFPGPSVAVSATGRNLAQGPKGPAGPQGPQGIQGVAGPAGSAGGAITAPTIWTATVGPSGGPTYSFPTGVNTKQNFDTTAGAIAATIDPTPTNGQLMGAKDVGLALATHALTLVTAGASVEWPAGVLTTSNIVLNAGDLGAGPLWQWFSALSSWRLPS
jgi:hypothetical protein